MSDEASAAEPEPTAGGAPTRLLRAAELLASAHASRAKDEAARDASRLLGGAMLLGVAVALAALAVLLLDAAAVLLVHERTSVGLAGSCAVVAACNALLALGVALVARGKLAAPLLRETRATLRRAVTVIRGA